MAGSVDRKLRAARARGLCGRTVPLAGDAAEPLAVIDVARAVPLDARVLLDDAAERGARTRAGRGGGIARVLGRSDDAVVPVLVALLHAVVRGNVARGA